ncbi:MAG: hypothetical protein EB051_01850 [Chlamydiia bacterium]|nr:hypothetical protein [Chlamydiia bacterium]
MNILMFISSMLIIFSFISATTSHHSLVLEAEKTSFHGYMQGLRHTRNMWQNKMFIDATKAMKSKPTTSTRTKTGPKKFSSHRRSHNPCLYSKFNIASLFSIEESDQQIASILTNLIEELYDHTSFVKESKVENLAHKIVINMQRLGKKQQDVFELQDLSPKDEPLKTIFYKMLKGSGYYALEKKEGYPPLADFLYVDKEKKKPFYFHFASYQVLHSVFGEKLTEQILELEKIKSEAHGNKRTLTKAELDNLLLNSHDPKHKQTTELFSFVKERGSLESLSYKNSKSKVCVKLKIF